MDEEIIDESAAATSAATETAPAPSAQGDTEVTPASTNTGDPAATTPPASESAPSELEEFKAEVARAVGQTPAKTQESEATTTETAAKTDEQSAEKGEGEETKTDLSQPDNKSPEKLTDRPEWQAITKIADKVGKEEGKAARSMLRELYKREYDLGQQLTNAKPAVEVVQEMFQAVGGNQQGFANMRHLIKSFDADPANAVPMLKTLLADAEKRAGLVLQSPELLTEAQQLDKAVEDGVLDRTAADKRKRELLELEQARTGQRRTQQQTEAQRQLAQRSQGEARAKAAVAEIETAANAWEKEKLANDPDYLPLKNLHTSRTFQLAEAEVQKLGRMLTGAEARKVADKALAEVKAEVGQLLPRKAARQAINGGGNGSSGTTRQTPMTELDEFRQEVEAAQKRHTR